MCSGDSLSQVREDGGVSRTQDMTELIGSDNVKLLEQTIHLYILKDIIRESLSVNMYVLFWNMTVVDNSRTALFSKWKLILLVAEIFSVYFVML